MTSTLIVERQAETADTPAASRDFPRDGGRNYSASTLATPRMPNWSLSRSSRRTPTTLQVCRALCELYEQEGDYRHYAEVLESLVEASSGEAQLDDAYAKLAHVFDEHLKEPEKALLYYDKALELDDSRIELLRGQEAVYVGLERYRELLENLQSQVKCVDTPRQKILLLETCRKPSRTRVPRSQECEDNVARDHRY